MTKIELTELEAKVLQLCAERKFEPDSAPVEEQDAHISLLDKAHDYELENDLVDERCDYTQDCNLLVWFAHRLDLQNAQETSKE